MLNIGALTDVLHSHYATMVLSEHGDPGLHALRKLLGVIRDVYGFIDPETYGGQLVIFKALDESQEVLPRSAATQLSAIKDVAQYAVGDCAIEILDGGQIFVWAAATLNIKQIAVKAIAYTYKARVESFHAGGKTSQVEKIVIGCASNFAIPTFDDLREALERYRSDMVRHSSCPIFATVWYEPERLFFKSKQEKTMRNSLLHYLKSRVRGGVEVRPEQIVDSTHPVDIKVTWFLSNRIALIEIKWLGKSRNRSRITSQHSQARALRGAKQLADYLDKNKVQAPIHKTRGYLVVIDGRRAKLAKRTKHLDTAAGMKYATLEITYNPKHHESRDDFEIPIRMFAEPVCQIGSPC